MKRIVYILMLALFVGAGLCVPGADASPSRGADCRQCHNFSNQPPVANAGADQTVNAGARVTLSGSASRDSDDGIASYAWTQSGGPSVTLSTANTVTATFTAPNVTTQTTFTFTLTVRDRLPQSSTDTCVVTVRPAATNGPPVANAGADQTRAAGASVTLNGTGSTDPDDGIGSYAWTQTGGTSVALANASAASATFTAPNVTAQTNLTFQLTVRDRANQASTDTCIVTVTPAGPTNRPPVANAGADQTRTAGSSVTLNGSGSTDPENGIASYLWAQTGGAAVGLSSTTAANPTFTAPQVTTSTALSFRLTVTDTGGLTSTDSITVTVTPSSVPPAGSAPVADAGLDQGVMPGSLNTLSGFYSSDADGTIVSYAWTQTAGPTVTLSDPTAMTTVFQAPLSLETLTFRLVVTDNSGLQDDDTCTVVVGGSGGGTTPPPVNQPPVARAGSDQTVRSGSTARLSGSGSSDPDNGIASYRWRQISGTSVSLSGSTSANASFRAPSVGSRGTTLTFELTVTDRGGLRSSDTVAINVTRAGGDDDDEEDDD